MAVSGAIQTSSFKSIELQCALMKMVDLATSECYIADDDIRLSYSCSSQANAATHATAVNVQPYRESLADTLEILKVWLYANMSGFHA
jgi:hypothetical protein